VVAKHQQVFRQNNLADDPSQKVVRKILERREQDIEDSLDDVAAAVPVVSVDNVVVATVDVEAPRGRSLEQRFAWVVFRALGGL